MYVLVVACGIVAARADEPIGAAPIDAVRMRPNAMFLPSFATELSVTGTLDPDHRLVASLALAERGFHGEHPGWSWLGLDGSVTADALRPDLLFAEPPLVYDARLTIHRRAGESNPVVAVSDARLGTVDLSADQLLGVRMDGLVQLADWSGGLYLPSLYPRDIDARIVVGLRALGARWRRYAPTDDGAQPDFVGVSVGGVSGELVYGRRVSGAAVVNLHLGGQSDWSVGSRRGLTLLTDTEAWVGGGLDLGRHHEVRLLGGARTVRTSDPTASALGTLTLSWRSTW